jgi:hypothetical protein
MHVNQYLTLMKHMLISVYPWWNTWQCWTQPVAATATKTTYGWLDIVKILISGRVQILFYIHLIFRVLDKVNTILLSFWGYVSKRGLPRTHSRTTSVDSVSRVVYVTKTRLTDWSIRKTSGDSIPRVVYVIKARFNDWSIMAEGSSPASSWSFLKRTSA